MNLILLYIFAPLFALLAFCVFLGALMSILHGDETHTLNAITGLGRWRGRRISRGGIFTMACISGILWISLAFLVIQTTPTPEEQVLDNLFEDGMKFFDDVEIYTLIHYQSEHFISGDVSEKEHREVILAVKDLIPEDLQPQFMKTKRGGLRPAIRVQLEKCPQQVGWRDMLSSATGVAYWHVGKHLGRRTASDSMHRRGRTDHPPGGFVTFHARWGKYLVSGLASAGRIAEIRKALAAEEFVVYGHD